MIYEGRSYRTRGDKLILTASPEIIQTGEWEILDIIGEGSSAVCYSCVHIGKLGRLKEYSPINTDSKRIEDFTGAYKTLDEVKCSNSNFEILNNYIPHYEILYECDENKNIISAFIWTPDDKKGTTFENYIKDVSVNSSEPGKTLTDIVSVVSTLADCICLIHMAGLLHLDIKPSNFLVTYNSRKEINTGNISLFDINTLYSIESDFSNITGTMGYCAPEVALGCPDNRSDIYSIGATLFAAIMKSGPKEYRIYDDSMFGRFDEIIRMSSLINDSKVTENSRAMELLCHIFERCLAADRNRRYDYCELLQKDIDDLLATLKAHSFGGNKAPETEKHRGRYIFAGIMTAAAVVVIVSFALWNHRLKTGNSTDNTQATIVSEPVEKEVISEKSIEKEDDSSVTDDNDRYICSIEEASENMRLLIEGANKEKDRNKKYVVISPETVGNDIVIFPNGMVIEKLVTVEFSDEMIFCYDDSLPSLTVNGTLICNKDTLFIDVEAYCSMLSVNFNDKSVLNSNGITFEFTNPEYYSRWRCGSLIFEVKRREYRSYIENDADIHITGTLEEMEEAGFAYFYGAATDGVRRLYEEGNEEPCDVYEAGTFDRLQNELGESGWGNDRKNDVYVDYPVVINSRQELFIPENITIHLVEGGSINSNGGYIVYNGFNEQRARIVEEGGKLIE